MKKMHRPIALFVALAFVALLQASAMPLRADQAPAAAVAGNEEQAPTYVEQPAAPSAGPKAKSVVPYILIGVGVIAVAAVLVLVVFKTQYDITIPWDYKWRNAGSATWNTSQSLVFAGSKKSGTVTYNNCTTVNYTVDGKKVTMSWTYSGSTLTITLTGEFQSKEKVTGTWSGNNGTSGDWELNKKATTSAAVASGPLMGEDR